VQYVQTCSSGTAAIHIAVAAAGIGLGDEVITSPITDIGTVIGVLYQQAVPVFADLGAGTYTWTWLMWNGGSRRAPRRSSRSI